MRKVGFVFDFCFKFSSFDFLFYYLSGNMIYIGNDKVIFIYFEYDFTMKAGVKKMCHQKYRVIQKAGLF